MMGKAEKVRRKTDVLAPAGSVLRIWDRRPSTYSSDWTMSTDQSKKTLISAEPRPVADRTVTDPGMSFIASSMGRVIVAIISSAGMTPLSTRMTTRGKLVCGNTEDGMWKAAYAPARQSARQRKTIATPLRAAKRATAESELGVVESMRAAAAQRPKTRIRLSLGRP